MFRKKIELPKIVTLSKEEELGPKPCDLPNDAPLITFQILLRHSLPSIMVQAHFHDFGTEANCDKPRSGKWTHFYVKDSEIWTDVRRHVETKYTDGSRDPFRATEVHRWQWVKHDKVRSVFSIRTDDVVMVVAKDNVAPVTEETLALELRAKPERPTPTMRHEYQFEGLLPNSFIGPRDIEL
jgi:hypothetical protein